MEPEVLTFFEKISSKAVSKEALNMSNVALLCPIL